MWQVQSINGFLADRSIPPDEMAAIQQRLEVVSEDGLLPGDRLEDALGPELAAAYMEAWEKEPKIIPEKKWDPSLWD